METARKLLEALVLELQDGNPFQPSGAMEMAVEYLKRPYDPIKEAEKVLEDVRYGLSCDSIDSDELP